MAANVSGVQQHDAIAFLTREHATVEQLFAEYQSLEGGDDVARRRSLVADMIRELRLHATMEEQSFYPSVREVVADGDSLVDDGLEEHAEAKKELAELESMPSDAPAYDAKVETLIRDVRHHVHEEENELLPKLRQAVGEAWLLELGAELQRTKQRLATEGVQREAEPDVEPLPPVLTREGPASRRGAKARTSSPKGRGAEKSSRTSRASAKKATAKSAATSSKSKPPASKKASTSTRATITYRVRPTEDGRWQVAKKGAARASSVHDRKSEAVARGKELARKQRRGRLVVHASSGEVQNEFTYGAGRGASR